MKDKTLVSEARSYITTHSNSWLAGTTARDHIAKLCNEIERLQAERDQIINKVYELGWFAAAAWGERFDLVHDIGSPAYIRERDEAIRSLLPEKK